MRHKNLLLLLLLYFYCYYYYYYYYYWQRVTISYQLKVEGNYHHSEKLEFLALKWAVCDHYRDYLYCALHFVIYTDNNPLTYSCKCSRLPN